MTVMDWWFRPQWYNIPVPLLSTLLQIFRLWPPLTPHQFQYIPISIIISISIFISILIHIRIHIHILISIIAYLLFPLSATRWQLTHIDSLAQSELPKPPLVNAAVPTHHHHRVLELHRQHILVPLCIAPSLHDCIFTRSLASPSLYSLRMTSASWQSITHSL